MRVAETLADARISSRNDEGGTLRERLEQLRVDLQDVIGLVVDADQQIQTAKAQGSVAERDVTQAKEIIDRARDTLKVRVDIRNG